MTSMEELRRLSGDALEKALLAEDRSEMSTYDIIDRIGLCLKPEFRKRGVDQIRFHHQLMAGGWKDNPSRVRWVNLLSDSDLKGLSAQITISRANRSIQKTMDIIRKKGYVLNPFEGHALDGRDLTDGIMRQVTDSRGKPAFAEAFDSEKWSTPVGVV